MTTKLPCTVCGALVLPQTAAETGGRCRPCSRGETRRRPEPPGEDYFDDWQALRARYERDGLPALSPRERDFFATNACKGAVLRGGIHLFFALSEPDVRAAAKAAFRRLGAHDVAERIEHAEAVVWPDGAPAEMAEQMRSFAEWELLFFDAAAPGTPALPDPLDAVNRELYARRPPVDDLVEQCWCELRAERSRRNEGT